MSDSEIDQHTDAQSAINGNGNGADDPDDKHIEPRSRSSRPAPAWLVITMLLGFLGGIGGFYVADTVSGDAGSSTQDESPIATDTGGAAEPPRTLDSGETYSPGEIYTQASPAVVHITARVPVREQSIFGFPQEREGVATGSGFVIDKEGHVVTNAHVVDGATRVQVGFGDDRTVEATVVGEDASTDIAVLDVDVKKGQLKPIAFADSTKVRVGDPVVAIGNPFSLDRTLTTGVVSALQRQIRGLNNFAINDVIQTDAAINPGNSGGPLLNMLGKVIGVNSQIQSRSGGNVGIGFAVPSNTVSNVVRQLIDDGQVAHAWLGITGTDMEESASDVFDFPVDAGVLINDVSQGSPAAKAGLKGGDRDVAVDGFTFRIGGDIIVSIDGEKVTSMQDVLDAVTGHKPGDTIEVEYYRGTDKKQTSIKLGTRPAGADSASMQR